MRRYILFDFDGTLANTNDIVTASWQATLRHYLGHEKPVREIEATFGEILRATMARFIPDVDTDEAVEYYRTFQASHQDEYKVYIYDGIMELIDELKARGCLIGVATSRTKAGYETYMKMLGLDAVVDEYVTMNDVSHHKPHPETAEAVLRKLAKDDRREWKEICDDAILIGDAKYDIGCAQNAGIDSVLIGWSHYIDEDELKASGFEPTYRIEKPSDLLEII